MKLKNVDVDWQIEVDEPGYVVITVSAVGAVASTSVPVEGVKAFAKSLLEFARRAEIDPAPARKTAARALRKARR